MISFSCMLDAAEHLHVSTHHLLAHAIQVLSFFMATTKPDMVLCRRCPAARYPSPPMELPAARLCQTARTHLCHWTPVPELLFEKRTLPCTVKDNSWIAFWARPDNVFKYKPTDWDLSCQMGKKRHDRMFGDTKLLEAAISHRRIF